MRMRGRGLLRRLVRDELGSEMLEFALSAMALLILILGITDVCRAMNAYHFAAYAAEEGAHYAQVRGADWTSSCSTSAPPNFTLTYGCEASATDVQNYVKNLALSSAVDSSAVSVDTATANMWPGTTPSCTTTPCIDCSTNANATGCFVRVKVYYNFKFLFPYFFRSTWAVSTISKEVIEY